jgi:chaperonin cofactor prefoldin
MELELADEDEPVLYKIASSFYHLSPEKANERVTQAIEVIDNAVDTLETDASECRDKMSELKTLLYAKFGSSINLER